MSPTKFVDKTRTRTYPKPFGIPVMAWYRVDLQVPPKPRLNALRCATILARHRHIRPITQIIMMIAIVPVSPLLRMAAYIISVDDILAVARGGHPNPPPATSRHHRFIK
jgi:hypothetical protein